jgi:hypothetical protein
MERHAARRTARLTIAQWTIITATAVAFVAAVVPAIIATAGLPNDQSSTAGLRLLWWIEPIILGFALKNAVLAARSADDGERARRFRRSAAILAFAAILFLYVRFG